MAFRIRSSYLVAFAIGAGIVGWMYNGEVIVGGQVNPENEAPPIAEREAKRSAKKFTVRYLQLKSQKRENTITVRGRTRAEAVISIRAETGGTIKKRLVNKGDFVKEGDLVCVIDDGIRGAQLAQSKAQLEQAEIEYEANKKLAERGIISKNRLTGFRSALDAARAGIAQSMQELSRTEVRANASGTVQAPIAEVGDVLSPGGNCVTLVDTDPMYFTGQISERDIAKVNTGTKTEVELFSGDKIDGSVEYIAPSADPKTRTFQVDVRLDSKGANILDGLTAKGRISLASDEAYLVKSSWLGLADNGEIGLRIVDENNTVRFLKIAIKSTTKDGFWLTGPTPDMRIITLGHEFVGEGEEVTPVPDTRSFDGNSDKTALLKKGE